ncbi:hypothetical protein [Neorhizobium sp. NCHU2750]|uniref:hypothetical protein n=1 Tax=Neorhizobium sp. NCHU2750 TaxID=1825976 RepID=UPI0013C4476E
MYHDDDQSDVAKSVRFLPAITALARKKIVKLYSSSELRDETWTQPSGRYQGYEIYDYSLFSGVEIETVKDRNYFMMMGPSSMGFPSLVDQRKSRMSISQNVDPIFLGLVDALGEKSSQDCYHIAFAEKNNTYCFLTMDFKLIRNLNSRRKHPVVANLKTKILSPYEFGTRFQLTPFSTRLFSHHKASFPVAWWENWPKSGRKPRKRRRTK